MDIERGNIEIVFQKIPYIYLIRKNEQADFICRYNKVDENLYMRYAAEVFSCATDDECRNNYRYMCETMQKSETAKSDNKKQNVFRLVYDLAEKMLRMDQKEIMCKFDQLLRWREISLKVGQDFFTCAFLAKKDVETGRRTQTFTWLPIIRSDNMRLHNILDKGIAENHFHLNGSTKVFELNWLCLMNHIMGRSKDFKKIKRTMQCQRGDSFDRWGQREDFYTECQRAAFYRVYLFLCLKNNGSMVTKAEEMFSLLPDGTETLELAGIKLSALLPALQELIMLTGNIYGAEIDGTVLDYALEKDMMQYNNHVCRLLAGERRFLYECYYRVLSGTFSEEQKKIFYAYLLIRTDFRGEIIQNNDRNGFANFSDYQDRKEYFIEGHKPYENELVRLALNETLVKKNMISLEARICPKNTSKKLYSRLKSYEKIVKCGTGENDYDKLIYVLHFPKKSEKVFTDGVPRNNNVRKEAARQARAIAALLEKKREINQHMKGIDACSSEIACRPEVFGQVFRYLSDKGLHRTYHAGEDFFDIVDGLRAIDEAILFCGLNRGDRLGHALALGINPEKHYSQKGYRAVLPKQVLLDDIAWIYCRANKFGCHIGERLKTELIEKYYQLYKELYENNTKEHVCPSVYEYYQSWKLRGDNPEVYRLDEKDFQKCLERREVLCFNRYMFNSEINDDLRKNERYRKLYYLYHYNRQVRNKGMEIAEYKIQKDYVSLVRQIQDKMIQELAYKGIGIETNPSSNYLIGTITKYDEHPILRFNSRKLKQSDRKNNLCVSVNTDDQGVFDTLLENEYGLMALALKKTTDENMNPVYDMEDIYEWIDYVRNMGIDQIFR